MIHQTLDSLRYAAVIDVHICVIHTAFGLKKRQVSLSLPREIPQHLNFVLPPLQAEVAAVVMTGGLAHVCLVTSHMTVTRARIEMNIPRKRAGSSDHQKAISRFYEAVYQVPSSTAISVQTLQQYRCHVSWIVHRVALSTLGKIDSALATGVIVEQQMLRGEYFRIFYRVRRAL